MKVRITRNLGKGLPDLLEGEVTDIRDTTLLKSLVDSGLAEVIDEPKPAEESTPKPKAAPSKPEPTPQTFVAPVQPKRAPVLEAKPTPKATEPKPSERGS